MKMKKKIRYLGIIFLVVLSIFVIDLIKSEVSASTYQTRMNLEEPQNGITSSKKVQLKGWVMTNAPDYSIKVYLNNQQVATITNRVIRNDVLNAILDCGGSKYNPKPGYLQTIDLSNYDSGTYTLGLKVIDNKTNQILEQTTRTINLQSYATTMNLELPANGQTVNSTMRVKGWVMSELKEAQIKVEINGTEVKTITNRVQRQDVLNAIKGYGGSSQNPKPGYEEYIDLSSYKDGTYSFTLKVIDPETNEILETTTRTIRLEKYPTTMNLEEPTSGQVASNSITIKGWVMSQNKDAQIKILINGEEVKTVTNRVERQDVLNAIKGYGGNTQNPKPGYKETIDISSYKEGTHKLTIKVINPVTQEVLETTTRTFTISRTSPYYYGIDVSHHQGTIDWAKVKQDGIDFAIIRAGYRGWGISDDGTDGKLVKDSKFDYNAEQAIKNGIPIGAYFFSQAINEKEAIEEANFMLSIIKNYNITYPVIIDVEYSGAPNNTGRADNVTKEMRTKICDAFLKVIKNAGYTPMIYADKYFATDNLDMSKLSSYQFWMAHYTGATQDNPFAKPSDYKGTYKMWQYTSKGSVNGISTDVDMNVWYK